MIIKKRISYSCYQVKQNEYFFPPTLLSQSLLMFFMQAKRSYYFDNFGENDLLTADNTNEHVWPLLPAHCLVAIGATWSIATFTGSRGGSFMPGVLFSNLFSC